MHSTTLLVIGLSCVVFSKAWQPPPSALREISTKLCATPEAETKETMMIPLHLQALDLSKPIKYGGDVTLEKVSHQPPIFVLRNILSAEECQAVMDSATEFEQGRTVSEESDDESMRKNSAVSWIGNEEGSLARRVAKKAHEILMPKLVFDSTRGVEPLQVVRYDEGGEYVLHHDSNERLLTVIYYLNGAGETWFPLADSVEAPATRLEALSYCDELQPDADGVVISCENRGIQVQQGDAVAFFNYFTDTSCDWRAIHAGLPVSSPKWIANHWFRYVPRGSVSAN